MREKLLGIPIDWINQKEVEDRFIRFVESGRPHQVTTVNPEFIMNAGDSDQYRRVLQDSDLSLPDGTGIVIAQTYFDIHPAPTRFQRMNHFFVLSLKYLTSPGSFPRKRIPGVDLVERLMQLGMARGWTFYLLGAKPGVAEQAAGVWRRRYPGVTIIGTSAANPDDSGIVSLIHEERPDILLVAYGSPKQDTFIARHKDELHVPIMVGVGGTFDYTAGVMKRPSHFIRLIGLEWLFRILQQPKRFRRIFRSTVLFFLLITRQDSN
jgi:N-acetylglucosaminyldiphosphoundecaprenol N-acetyl-beta-D-mannosaminyltransferase